MPISSESQPAVAHPRPRFQFSLRSLLIFTLFFAIFCAGVFNPYNGVRYVTLLAVQAFLFYVYLTWSIYSRGYLQTFGIGAALSFLFPWLATAYFWIVLPIAFLSSNNMRQIMPGLLDKKSLGDGLEFLYPCILAFILLIDSLFTGGTMVFARWMMDRRRRQVAPTVPATACPLASATTAEVPPTPEGVRP
jgi:hypothetical protein